MKLPLKTSEKMRTLRTAYISNSVPVNVRKFRNHFDCCNQPFLYNTYSVSIFWASIENIRELYPTDDLQFNLCWIKSLKFFSRFWSVTLHPGSDVSSCKQVAHNALVVITIMLGRLLLIARYERWNRQEHVKTGKNFTIARSLAPRRLSKASLLLHSKPIRLSHVSWGHVSIYYWPRPRSSHPPHETLLRGMVSFK